MKNLALVSVIVGLSCGSVIAAGSDAGPRLIFHTTDPAVVGLAYDVGEDRMVELRRSADPFHAVLVALKPDGEVGETLAKLNGEPGCPGVPCPLRFERTNTGQYLVMAHIGSLVRDIVRVSLIQPGVSSNEICVARSGKATSDVSEAGDSCRLVDSIVNAFYDARSNSVVVVGGRASGRQYEPVSLRFSLEPVRLVASAQGSLLGFSDVRVFAEGLQEWKSEDRKRSQVPRMDQRVIMDVDDADATDALVSGDYLYMIERQSGQGSPRLVMRAIDSRAGVAGSALQTVALPGTDNGAAVAGVWVSTRGTVIVAAEAKVVGSDRSVPGWRNQGREFRVFEVAGPDH